MKLTKRQLWIALDNNEDLAKRLTQIAQLHTSLARDLICDKQLTTEDKHNIESQIDTLKQERNEIMQVLEDWYTFDEQELIQGYNEMAATNIEIADEFFKVEVEAQQKNEQFIEEDFNMMTMTNWRAVVEVMGFDVSKYEEYKLDFLIQSEADLQELLGLFNEMKPRTLLSVISQFRKNRIDANLIPVGEFVTEYINNPIQALESLFVELVLEDDITKINNNEITAEQIYQYHLSNPYGSLLTFLSFYRNGK